MGTATALCFCCLRGPHVITPWIGNGDYDGTGAAAYRRSHMGPDRDDQRDHCDDKLRSGREGRNPDRQGADARVARGVLRGNAARSHGPSGLSRSPHVFASKIGIEKSSHAAAPAGPGKRRSTQDGSHDSLALTPVKTATRAFPQACRRIGRERDDFGGRAAI